MEVLRLSKFRVNDFSFIFVLSMRRTGLLLASTKSKNGILKRCYIYGILDV